MKTVQLRDLERARQFPLLAPEEGNRRGEVSCCPACGGEVQEVLLTTEPRLWEAYPLAVDAWVCGDCGNVLSPRFLEPEEAEAAYQGGLAAAEAGQYEVAERALRRLANGWPRYAPARVCLAQVRLLRLEEKGESDPALLDEVELILKQALAGEGLSSLAPLGELMARVYLARGDLEAARQAILELPLEEEESAHLLEWVETRGDLYDRGTHRLEAILDGGRPASREEVMQALDDVLEHLQHHPGSVKALLLAGRAQAALQESSAACILLRRAYEIKPDRADVAREYSMALLRNDQVLEALEPARLASESAPEDGATLTNFALATLLNGDPHTALSLAEQALRLNPRDPINRNLLLLLEDVRMGRRPVPRSLSELG